MPVVNNVKADHHVYIIAGKIDGDVCAQQARRKWEKLGETSVLHWHDADTECGHPQQQHKVIGDVQFVESSPG